MFKRTSLITVLFLALAATAEASPTHVDVKIKKYTSVPGVSGVLNITGSVALSNLISFWSEEFKRV
jgi:ABC-type phosphate transport system substrate-binding protein